MRFTPLDKNYLLYISSNELEGVISEIETNLNEFNKKIGNEERNHSIGIHTSLTNKTTKESPIIFSSIDELKENPFYSGPRSMLGIDFNSKAENVLSEKLYGYRFNVRNPQQRRYNDNSLTFAFMRQKNLPQEWILYFFCSSKDKEFHVKDAELFTNPMIVDSILQRFKK